MAYGGSGVGLVAIKVKKPEAGWGHWLQATHWGTIEEAIGLRIERQFGDSPAARQNHLRDLVTTYSTELDMTSSFDVKDETYLDAAANPALARFIISKEPAGTVQVAPNRLTGLTDRQIRIPGVVPGRDPDGIDLMLRIAEINLEIAMANSFELCDLNSSGEAEGLLLGKLQRLGATPTQLQKFIQVSDLASVPDIRPVIADGEIGINDVLNMRDGEESTEFRTWIHNADAKDGRDLERLYVQALGRQIPGWKSRVLRASLTKGAAIVTMPLGVAGKLVDSFLMSKFLNGYNPKLFLDSIEEIRLKNEKAARRVAEKSARNAAKRQRKAQKKARKKSRPPK